MSATADPLTAAPPPRLFSFMRGFRLIPRIDTYPWAVTFAQTIAGKATLLALFGLGLYYATYLHYLHNPRWKVQICCLVVITALPKYRRYLLTLCAFVWAFGIWWQWAEHPQIIEAGISLVLGAFIFWLANRFRDTRLGRRPVATLLTGFALAVLLASYLPREGSARAVAFNFLPVFGAYLWCIAYSLLDLRSKSHDRFTLQAGAYQPFWGSANTPFVKGAAYLRRIEAKNAEQLAIAQIKGLKLLAWSVILDLFLNFVCIPFVHGYLGIPFYEFTFHQSVHRLPFPWYMGWGSLIAEFLRKDDRLLNLRPPHRGHLPNGGFHGAEEYVPAIGVALAGGVLEPLLLLLQGTAGRLFLLSDLRSLFQAARALAVVRGDFCGRRVWQCLLPLLSRSELH